MERHDTIPHDGAGVHQHSLKARRREMPLVGISRP